MRPPRRLSTAALILTAWSCGTNEPSPDAGPGRLVFERAGNGLADIYAIDARGQHLQQLTTSFATARDGNDEIYVMNPDGTAPVNLTNNAGSDLTPAWSPDGSKIAFESNREGDYAVWVMNADGSNPVRLTEPRPPSGAPSWSPGGTRIAYEQNGDIWIMNVDGSRQIRVTGGVFGGGADPSPRRACRATRGAWGSGY